MLHLLNTSRTRLAFSCILQKSHRDHILLLISILLIYCETFTTKNLWLVT